MNELNYQRRRPLTRRDAQIIRIEWVKSIGDIPQPFDVGFGFYAATNAAGNFLASEMCEVFAAGPKEGSLMQDIIHGGCIKASMLRQMGMPFKDILKSVAGVTVDKFPSPDPATTNGPPLFIGGTPNIAILKTAAIVEMERLNNETK